MKKLIIFLAIAVMGCCLSGCGAYYNVKVNGYTEAGTTRQITSGGSFCVIENKEAKNPLLEGEIKEKINKLLESQGYSLTTFDKAEYFLFFSYGMGEPRSLTVIVPDYYATGWGVGYGRPGPVYHFWVPPVLFSMPSIITTTYSRLPDPEGVTPGMGRGSPQRGGLLGPPDGTQLSAGGGFPGVWQEYRQGGDGGD
jgi:hypothetical protein